MQSLNPAHPLLLLLQSRLLLAADASATVTAASSIYAPSTNSSRITLVQWLRANGDHLQEQLDHWDATVLRGWLVNPESAREHAQTGPQQLQRH
jgi:hypothetical protein